jgi:hypothetical protein
VLKVVHHTELASIDFSPLINFCLFSHSRAAVPCNNRSTPTGGGVAHYLLFDPMVSTTTINGNTNSRSSFIKSILKRKKSSSWKQHVICSYLMSIRKGLKRRIDFH